MSAEPEAPEAPEVPEVPEAKPPVITPVRVIVALCLFAPFVAMLWVSSYAKTEPAFIGIPFFYWYQIAWLFLTAGITTFVYRKTR
jgi:hypothetical protein